VVKLDAVRVCRACQGAGWNGFANGSAFDPGYCAMAYNGGSCELQKSRPAIRAGLQMCGQTTPWMLRAGPYIAL
jgi:hypothetical protein